MKSHPPPLRRLALTALAPLLLESSLSDLLLTSSAHPPLALELVVECAFAALFSSFVGLFVTRIGAADRILKFRTQTFVVPPAPPP